MRSPDGGLTWTTLDGSQDLETPVVDDVTGPADMIQDFDELGVHTWLTSMLVRNGSLHLAYWVDGDPDEVQYRRYSVSTGALEVRSQPFFPDDPTSRKNNSGFFSAALDPGAPLFYVTGDRERLHSFVSADGGETWMSHAVGDVSYPMNDEDWHGIYSIGGAREPTSDGAIIGTFTEVADFAYSYFEDGSGKAHFFRVDARVP